MKHASILALITLAACGDSKPPPAPAKPATADVGVATKPVEHVVTELNAVPADMGTSESTPAAAEPATPAAVSETAAEPDKPDESHADESKPRKEAADAKKSDEKTAKVADAPAATTAPAKVEELSVQVLQEGSGAVVKRGDTVTLEYTISYMPKPEKKDDAKKKDTKGSKKSDAKKTDDKKAEEAKPKEDAKEGDKPAEDKKEAAAAEPKENGGEKAADKSDEKPADDKQAGEKSADAKKDEPKSAESKPIEPLKPVIVASTKSFPTPFTVKLTETGKPKLLPGLVRGVEGLKVGTRARILVPAALAYGKEGSKSAGIPPETPLEIEVFVKDARE